MRVNKSYIYIAGLRFICFVAVQVQNFASKIVTNYEMVTTGSYTLT